MKFGAAFWVQRTDWASLREAATEAEAAGFDSLWIDDHLLCDEGAWTDDKLEGWTVAAALATLTIRPTIGLLVAANTFRNPGVTAKHAVTLDHVSDGRAVLGIGAAWFEREHVAFDLDFGASAGERLDRLGESLSVIERLLAGDHVDHRGPAYTLSDAVCRPLPRQTRLPVLIGGSGPRKTIPLVARYADMWNAFGSPETLSAKDSILDERCRELGRDPATIERTVNHNVVIRESTERARADWAGWSTQHAVRPGDGRALVGGTPRDVAAILRPYVEIGFDHLVWIFRSPWDLETIRRLPEVRAELAG